MNHRQISLLILLFSVSLAAQETIPAQKKWKPELTATNFLLKFNGKLHMDYHYFFSDSESVEVHPDSGRDLNLSSADFKISGFLWNFDFAFKLEFASGNPEIKDAYLGVSQIPLIDNLRLGYFKEPFRISSLTGSDNLSFTDRPDMHRFSQSRNSGIMIFNEFFNSRLAVQTGYFLSGSGFASKAFQHDGNSFTTRITGLPFLNQNQGFLHLGIAYSLRNPKSERHKISISPGAPQIPGYLNFQSEEIRKMDLLNFESVFVHRSFYFQAEYLKAFIHQNSGTEKAVSFYGEGGFFLTGETRKYRNSYSGFQKNIPATNFLEKNRGIGAWELVFRYSATRFYPESPQVSQQEKINVGINWYVNPFSRFYFNFGRIYSKNNFQINTAAIRLQVDF